MKKNDRGKGQFASADERVGKVASIRESAGRIVDALENFEAGTFAEDYDKIVGLSDDAYNVHHGLSDLLQRLYRLKWDAEREVPQ